MNQMMKIHCTISSFFFFFFFFFLLSILQVQALFISPTPEISQLPDGFDHRLYPEGIIRIKWDIMGWGDGRYQANVNIYNDQIIRHVEKPGWRLRWAWQRGEVIWHIKGAEATEQGDCSKFKDGELPHSCECKPVIVDLLPTAPFNIQTQNCCKAGVLTSIAQDPSRSLASFQLDVGYTPSQTTHCPSIDPSRINCLHEKNATLVSCFCGYRTDIKTPENFSIGLNGYTCGNATDVFPPSRFPQDHGRRHTQAFKTWNVTCVYSQLLVSKAPTCCVSLSAFYNESIIPCPTCTCSCPDQLHQRQCVKPGDMPDFLELPHSDYEDVPPIVMCTRHRCPIHIHWHVKTSYKEYWRVKITINNLNYVKNYSDWSLVVEHPNLQSIAQIFSFNYTPIPHMNTNDTGMFWGIKTYNDMLLQSGKYGNVQTEMLLHKDKGDFTFDNGWAFPRKIVFNGDICVMPPPDQYPLLPNESLSNAINRPYYLSPLLLLVTLMLRL